MDPRALIGSRSGAAHEGVEVRGARDVNGGLTGDQPVPYSNRKVHYFMQVRIIRDVGRGHRAEARATALPF